MKHNFQQLLTVFPCLILPFIWIYTFTFCFMCFAESDDFTFFAVYPSDKMMVRIVRTESATTGHCPDCSVVHLLPLNCLHQIKQLSVLVGEVMAQQFSTFWLLASWNDLQVKPLWNHFIHSCHSVTSVMMSSPFAVYPSDLNGLLKLWLTELKCLGEINHGSYKKKIWLSILIGRIGDSQLIGYKSEELGKVCMQFRP